MVVTGVVPWSPVIPVEVVPNNSGGDTLVLPHRRRLLPHLSHAPLKEGQAG